MLIRHWHGGHEIRFPDGPVARVLKNVRSRDPQLWELVRIRLEEAEREGTPLAHFEHQSWAERLPHTEGLYEFRFPPQRKKGVIRIYFCCDPQLRNCIWLLEAEYKTGSSKKKHKTIIGAAEQKCREIRS